MKRRIIGVFCLTLIILCALWAGRRDAGEKKAPAGWEQVAPGVLRSPGLPAGYALVSGERALLIDAPHGADGLAAHGVQAIDGVLLTHHHRDTAAAAGTFLTKRVPVRAPRASAPWL